MYIKTKYSEPVDELTSAINLATDRAEEVYHLWLNDAPDLSPAEINLAETYQRFIEYEQEEEGDTVEVQLEPEHSITQEELDACIRAIERIKKAGLDKLIQVLMQ